MITYTFKENALVCEQTLSTNSSRKSMEICLDNLYVLYILELEGFEGLRGYYFKESHSVISQSTPTCSCGWLKRVFLVSKVVYKIIQRAKKVVSDSPGLLDFAIGLLNSVFNLPDGQVVFFEEFE